MQQYIKVINLSKKTQQVSITCPLYNKTSAVQEPVVVLCGTRCHASQARITTQNWNAVVWILTHTMKILRSVKWSRAFSKKSYRRLRRTPQRHFQGAVYILLPIGKQTVPPSCWHISITIYDVTCQKHFFSPSVTLTLRLLMSYIYIYMTLVA